eukprot:CAMPEP_0168823794 /NCGR_PEP_ID=MMETSP0726-20121227/10743_1 /TAXON_ID=265536 /ORGANISM="Amphiprora sp., Strain CCMP467" /LENGTH=34 /DNA_ID= /DNA_START= /DNA_END= /DNA_ORIENTATION=
MRHENLGSSGNNGKIERGPKQIVLLSNLLELFPG